MFMANNKLLFNHAQVFESWKLLSKLIDSKKFCF